MEPFFAMVRFTKTKKFPPVSNNWRLFGNAEFDKLIADARTSFDEKSRDAALAKLHARIVEEAPFVWIAHDVGPRALSPKVKNVVQPKSWFIDIATMTMDLAAFRFALLPDPPHHLRPAHHAGRGAGVLCAGASGTR